MAYVSSCETIPMKSPAFRVSVLAGILFASFVLLFSSAAAAELQPGDVPRATQIGTGPIPEGSRAAPAMPADLKLPTLWLIGDSTVRNGSFGDGTNLNQWGWGAPLTAFFDAQKVNVVNRAWGGTSSRSFYEGWFWRLLKPEIKRGDIVMLQFGANDNARASLPGTGDETEGNLHTFGWYLKRFVEESRAAGATVIICSLTPRKAWTPEGKFVRDNTTHAAWAAQVAKETNAPFIDLYELIARRYEALGPAKVDTLYVPSPTERLHTGWDGAVVNAECVIAGLKALKDNPLAGFFSERAKAIAP
jgi:rhamnogalacturonan acetylesterase